MSTEKRIKFAVIGTGHIGNKHATIISGHPECELVAVVDTDKNRLKEISEKFKVKGFESADALFDSNIAIDVVCVATPNYLHGKQSLEALEQKCHVVIEKPMGLTKQECEEVIFKSLQVSKNVFCVKQNRYSPTSVWLKSLINENRLGKINMVQLNCYWNRDDRYYKVGGWKGTLEKDGGVLFTQFSHFIDIMYWLFGDIHQINGRMINFNHQKSTEFEDTGMVQFQFINGGMGSINFSTSIWGQNMESSIAIIGEKGSVKVSGQYMDTVTHCVVENYEMPTLPPANPPNDYGEYKGSAANHHYVIENVVDVIAGRATISTNALEGMKVVEMIERIYRKCLNS